MTSDVTIKYQDKFPLVVCKISVIDVIIPHIKRTFQKNVIRLKKEEEKKEGGERVEINTRRF